jgi:hypothetical protein
MPNGIKAFLTSRGMLAATVGVLLHTGANAQYGDAGTTGLAFLNLDFNARTIAMGGAAAALPNGLYGVYVNPAAGGFIDKREAVCGVRSIIEDVWGGPLAYALPTSKYGVFSINLSNISFGSLTKKIEGPDGRMVQTDAVWKSYALFGGIGWSKIVVEALSVGAAVQATHHYFGSAQDNEYYSANSICLQAGAQYRMLNSRLITGIALNNAGFMLSGYTSEYETMKLPLSLTVGISYVPYYVPDLRIALDIVEQASTYLVYKPGIELALYKKYLFGRFGYRFSERDLEEGIKILKGEPSEGYQMTTWYGPSFGIGVVTDIGRYALDIDAAFQVNEIDNIFALSFLVSY